MATMATMATEISQYQKYWLKLLDEGSLVIQVPTSLVATIKKAIIVRKYRHHQVTGELYSPLKIVAAFAFDARGEQVIGKVQLTFKMHNLRLKDI